MVAIMASIRDQSCTLSLENESNVYDFLLANGRWQVTVLLI